MMVQNALPPASTTPVFCIRRDVLEALSPLHKMAALSAIQRGHWSLDEGLRAPVSGVEYGQHQETAVHS